MRTDNLFELPSNLPVPVDDGAADHLLGAAVPDISLISTSGRSVALSEMSMRRHVVVYCYPRTGQPNQNPPEGWDDVPGARGCTPQACGYRDYYSEFTALGIDVVGLSVQDTHYQREMVERLHLPFEVLSDSEFRLTNAMRLPTLVILGQTLLHRTTLILRNGKVEKVFYPVFPPNLNAEEVLSWARSVPHHA